MNEPFSYKSKVYYPLFADGCRNCHANQFCGQFKDRLKAERPDNYQCSPYGSKEIIWQHGKKASIQHITKRLTS